MKYIDERVKTVLGVVLILSVVALGYSAIRVAETYSNSLDPATSRSFTVSAQGSATATPDVARFTFSVITEGGDDIESLQESNSNNMNRAIESLNEQGIPNEDISTESYNVRPRYQHSPCPSDGGLCPPSEIVGYTISNSAEVTIRDFDVVGDMLSTVVDNGANEVSQMVFTVDDPTEVENQARSEAIRKAEAKAESVADAGGFDLGRLIGISEGGDSNFSAPRAFPESMDAASTRIEPGTDEVTIDVSVTYEIR